MNIAKDNPLFLRNLKLLQGSIYPEAIESETFWFVKSKFKDVWYNYIVPIVSPADFSWDSAAKIISAAEAGNREIAFCIPEDLMSGYQPELIRRGYKQLGSEVYMYQEISEKFGDVTGDLVPVTKENLAEYLDIAVKCFPEWKSEKEYSQYFFDLEHGSGRDTLYKSYLLSVDHEFVAFGSIVMSPKLNLTYLHNAGTLPKYRHQGHYLNMVKHRCNVAIDSGVNEFYSLVDKSAGSYKALKKMGFEPKATSYLFAK